MLFAQTLKVPFDRGANVPLDLLKSIASRHPVYPHYPTCSSTIWPALTVTSRVMTVAALALAAVV